MSSEPQGLSFPSTSSRSSPISLHSFDHLRTHCFQMPESQCHQSNVGEGFAPYSQRESAPYRQKSAIAERFRRHSVDGSPVGQEPAENGHFHPYIRQYSEGAVPEVQAFRCLRAGLAAKLTTAIGLVEQTAWSPLSSNVDTTSFMGTQQPYNESETRTEDPPSYTSHQTYSTLAPLEQQFSGVYSSRGTDIISHYCNQSLSSQTSQDTSAPPLYPKPVYSYRNSKTGSLPVSEIYSFMTEHFPYFKTAPDGWKNSVRHNLSLNKCFEKVENKNGNSSRKGCLWALNPAKVEKMQEELHKWRRKDPLTVRRSMARPEELERLLGERPEKSKTLGAHFNLQSSHTHFHPLRVGMHPSYGQPPVHDTSVQHQTSPYSPMSPQTAHLSPSYITPDPFSFYSPASQPYCTGHSSSNLDSPLPAHTPPSYSTALQVGHGTAVGMQELLLDGEISNDVDALNPSLTDLQLHGNLWEELRNDSLAPDTLAVMDSSPSPPQLSPSQASGDVEVYGFPTGELGSVETDSRVQGSISELYLNGIYTTTFSSADSMPCLLSTPENTPIPLL